MKASDICWRFQQKGRDWCVLIWLRLPILFWLIPFPLLALLSRFRRSHAYQKYFHKFRVIIQGKQKVFLVPWLLNQRWSHSYDQSSADFRGTVLCGKVLDGVIKTSCAPSIKLFWELLSPYISKLVITYHIVQKVALSRTKRLKVCGTVFQPIKLRHLCSNPIRNGAADFGTICPR